MYSLNSHSRSLPPQEGTRFSPLLDTAAAATATDGDDIAINERLQGFEHLSMYHPHRLADARLAS